jgi:RNA polymerase subunit RPABC4/transcription elongation factor Spt4
MIADPVPFLANIALVAHADRKLSASELGQLEAIRAELKFKKGDYTAAIRLVEQGSHKMTPVGSFADQVLNLEMILRVAYSDDDLDQTEAGLVEEFCKAVGIYQDQLDKICREVMASLKRHGKVCPSCGSSADADARFCPKCGTSVAFDEASIRVELDIPPSGIAIEFAESSAASFPSALEIAKTGQGFQSCQKGKKTWYLAVYPTGNLTDALPLAQALSGIRNRRVYFDGAEKQWDEVFGFAWCASQRATAYRPIEYCFGKDENRINPWGCKQARMDWTDWANWFSYGRWEKGGLIGGKVQWRFDKERIKHELATNLFRYRFCPYLRAELSEAVLRHLPDTVLPESDPNWQYNRQYEEVPGAIKVVEKDRSDGFVLTNEYSSDGVRPKGLRVLADILSKALADIGGSEMSVQHLLK